MQTKTSDRPEDAGTMSLAEFAAANDNRARMYTLLSRLFASEVDRKLLDELHEARFPIETGDESVDEGNSLMAGYLSNIWDGTVQELAVDYVHCFIGSGDDAFSAAYPFESVYTSPRRLTMQEARDEVLAIYRSQGYEKAQGWTESEDHVAAELEFMAALCHRAALACEEGDAETVGDLLRTQQGFLEDHLYSWTRMLTADMRKFARTDFYKGLASLLDGSLQTERELLGSILGE